MIHRTDKFTIKHLSIILPARNEAKNLQQFLPILQSTYPEVEIIVVNDGSTDDTESVSLIEGIKIVSHPYNMGNGAAIKTGARTAQNDILVFMDADGQHDIADISRLIAPLEEGYTMVVGTRQVDTHASLIRRWGNSFYNHLASAMTGFRIEDLTSGFRAVRAQPFRKFLYLLPNGFSYPTTITMAFLRSGLPVAYVPIKAKKRMGKSHIRLLRDGIRFFVIILKIGTLFSPMRLFLPISGVLFLTGVSYYLYTFITLHRFTNMSALLILSSVFTFLMGILSEQIAALHYKSTDENHEKDKDS